MLVCGSVLGPEGPAGGAVTHSRCWRGRSRRVGLWGAPTQQSKSAKRLNWTQETSRFPGYTRMPKSTKCVIRDSRRDKWPGAFNKRISRKKRRRQGGKGRRRAWRWTGPQRGRRPAAVVEPGVSKQTRPGSREGTGTLAGQLLPKNRWPRCGRGGPGCMELTSCEVLSGARTAWRARGDRRVWVSWSIGRGGGSWQDVDEARGAVTCPLRVHARWSFCDLQTVFQRRNAGRAPAQGLPCPTCPLTSGPELLPPMNVPHYLLENTHSHS